MPEPAAAEQLLPERRRRTAEAGLALPPFNAANEADLRFPIRPPRGRE